MSSEREREDKPADSRGTTTLPHSPHEDGVTMEAQAEVEKRMGGGRTTTTTTMVFWTSEINRAKNLARTDGWRGRWGPAPPPPL